MPDPKPEVRERHTLREPAPDEQGRPTHEAGGPEAPDRRQREQRTRPTVLREER
ncbi:hypothetical protein [Deinococcus multiflagellatus]|uniref:Uncharacterized protein n=1 Tax=Deinococcus multiflagellatus TaxID=1656887 RepID=A0ABW1ZJV6_9DEIO|nr:hypothetical protein [Deinococcus multiflagellatus]MBZ9713759.1 hypothetical protein [Deinococcus multiflagellatus]